MRNLYVGNFSFRMTDPELRELFMPYGTVESTSIARNARGISRGFALVTMATDADAEKAMIELNGKEIEGKALTVNPARPQKEHS